VQPLRDQLTDAGFEVLFTCTDDACGGFDFRFARRVADPQYVIVWAITALSQRNASVDGTVELLSLLAVAPRRRGSIIPCWRCQRRTGGGGRRPRCLAFMLSSDNDRRPRNL
jgi:hypothetical protein